MQIFFHMTEVGKTFDLMIKYGVFGIVIVNNLELIPCWSQTPIRLSDFVSVLYRTVTSCKLMHVVNSFCTTLLFCPQYQKQFLSFSHYLFCIYVRIKRPNNFLCAGQVVTHNGPVLFFRDPGPTVQMPR